MLVKVGISIAIVAALGQQHAWELKDFVPDIRAQIFHRLPEPVRQVVVVSITEDDYQHLFDARSPLDEMKLREIVEKILAGKPAVLGVDVQTDTPQFRSLRDLQSSTVIVWARPSVSTFEGGVDPGNILGGGTVRMASGVAVFPTDSEDSGTRRYQRRIETTKGAEDTFAWAVARQSLAKDSSGNGPSAEHDFVLRDIRYTDTPARPERTASQVLAHDFAWNDSIVGKTVLLGGRYYDADKHKTPYADEMDGVDIVANAVETEINHRSEPSVTWLQLLLLAVIVAPVLNGLFAWKSFTLALVLSLLLVLDAYPPFFIAGASQLWIYGALFTLLVIMEEWADHFTDDAREAFIGYAVKKHAKPIAKAEKNRNVSNTGQGN